MRAKLIEWLIENNDPDIYLITPDMGFNVVEKFKDRFPDRFINVGIAEQNAVNIAVGLALCGKKPYLYGISTFLLYRAFEQIRNYVIHLNLNIKIIGVGKGMTYSQLEYSHWAVDDIDLYKGRIEIVEPTEENLIESLERIYESKNPVYVRLS